MFIRNCAVCGREFEAQNGNSKYCSEECRIEGKRAARQEWVVRTDYNAKKRHAMELYRAKITEEEYQKQKKAEKNRRAALKRKHTIERNRKEEELQAKAASGDLLACLSIALNEKDHLYSVSYWQALQNYQLDQLSLKDDYVVNGISVRDPDFPKKVVYSLESEKKIVSSLVRNR